MLGQDFGADIGAEKHSCLVDIDAKRVAGPDFEDLFFNLVLENVQNERTLTLWPVSILTARDFMKKLR